MRSAADAEFGRPQWMFGTATWAFADASRIVVSYTHDGRWQLALDRSSRAGVDVDARRPDLEPREWLDGDRARTPLLVAGGRDRADAIVRIDLATGAAETCERVGIAARPGATISVPSRSSSRPAAGSTAHAFYYPPRNPDAPAPAGERPPLIVISHGGPTDGDDARRLDLEVQFWTSRGFAVVDVNYGGSTGYGRAYRERLNGQWGIVDVEDAINAAQAPGGAGQGRSATARSSAAAAPAATRRSRR